MGICPGCPDPESKYHAHGYQGVGYGSPLFRGHSPNLATASLAVSDPSFDTNPEQHRETLGNELNADSAYLSGFCNFQQPLELRRHSLLISRFQVRVLGSSLLKALHTAAKDRSPGSSLGLLYPGACSYSLERPSPRRPLFRSSSSFFARSAARLTVIVAKMTISVTTTA
jgi:hypothetical protein